MSVQNNIEKIEELVRQKNTLNANLNVATKNFSHTQRTTTATPDKYIYSQIKLPGGAFMHFTFFFERQELLTILENRIKKIQKKLDQINLKLEELVVN